MKIDIIMLNVEDADAIIVVLNDGIKNFVAIIDAGRSEHSEQLITRLDSELSKYNKKGPDLLLATHYDSDHIGGIPAIINKYGRNIKELWIHNPSFKPTAVLNPLYLKPRFITLANNIYKSKKMEVVMESVNELKNVIQLANDVGIRIKEPIAKECQFDGWPSIQLIGPTRGYYRSVFKNITTAEAFIIAEAESLVLVEEAMSSASVSKNPCNDLPVTSKITPTNQASAIVKIIVDGKKYIFTGDAGIESFAAIPDFENELKDVYWLKAPHHGSINNLSQDLIRLMSPKYVYISGNGYTSESVIRCLQSRGSIVKTTSTSGDLCFSSTKQRFHEMLQYL